MPCLTLRPVASCQYDILTLGEVMLRLDPGEGRIRTAREFRAWEGGGEYNVARGLRRCFGQRAGLVTALAKNEVGLLIEDLILQGGVDPAHILWRDYDGIGRSVRNGLNFTERGFGVRGAIGCSDRGMTAVSQLRPGDVDWDHIFGTLGVRWFHTGGIFAGLSETTGDVAIEAAQAARRHGTIVSYDLNYRPSLWDSFGGLETCRAINRAVAQHVDVMIGNEGHFDACLGIELDPESAAAPDSFQRMVARATADFPNFTAIATTRRGAQSATRNAWSAMAWVGGAVYRSVERELEIMDRVGGGDSFASGFIYGLMAQDDPGKAVEYGAAHGALAMTTPGDTTMASLAEVEALMRGGGAREAR